MQLVCFSPLKSYIKKCIDSIKVRSTKKSIKKIEITRHFTAHSFLWAISFLDYDEAQASFMVHFVHLY